MYDAFSVEHTPHIDTCRQRLVDEHGNMVDSIFKGNSTSCDNTVDVFTNLQPHTLSFDFEFIFKLPEDPPSEHDRHDYVNGFVFGTVGAKVQLVKHDHTGEDRIYVCQFYSGRGTHV